MTERTILVICEEMLAETEAAVRAEELQNVQIVPYPFSWYREKVDWSMISKLLADAGVHSDRGCIVITERMGLFVDAPKELGRWRKVTVRRFTDLFLADDVAEKLEDDGAYPMLPARSDECLRLVRIAGPVAGISGKRTVLVDVMGREGLVSKAKELEVALGMPSEVMSTDIDIFRLNISGMLLRAMLSAETETLRTVQTALDKTKADTAMILDVLDRISRLKDEQSVIGSVLDLFIVLFSPRSIMYASERNGAIEGISFRGKPRVIWDPRTVSEACGSSSYALTKNGLCLQIRNMGTTVGWVELIDLEYPEHRDKYLEMARPIGDVFALSISNARAFQEMRRMQDVIMDLNEAMRLINKTMRHDLMNEMAISSGALQLFRSKHDDRKLDMADNSIQRSIRLIEDMRDLEAGLVTQRPPEPMKVREVLRKVLATFDLPSSVEGDETTVAADGALQSVFENIIRNAIIHGGTDRVHVLISSDGTNCTVSIMDWGKGIPDGIKNRIFDEGYKYGTTGGSGVGLYIVMKVMKRYGGSVTVRDNVPKGTIFDLTLPISKQGSSDPAAVISMQPLRT